MDLIVELKITNISDWIAIQPLLQRLKIPFVQRTVPKEVEQTAVASDAGVEALLALQRESSAFFLSPYDSEEAAETLLKLLKSN